MAIEPGTRLGPYEIVAQLGAGGMGEVWRAKDTRLDRDVAIKILPDSIAADEMARARFEREAKVISSMSHPNICVLHDIGHEGDTHYLVMELIEGETLEVRLKNGPLPPAEVLRYGAQIADALDRAHKQSVVHRDLKPGNVMVTKDGAKLLDFGLARPVTQTSSPERVSETATRVALTTEGSIIGTFQYMAPEQLEGEEADARTDIFALGALLYEMATGRPAFQGKSRTSLIAAIVSSEPPPISSLQAMTPPALDHVVRQCLEKKPDDRWQSARDVASQLHWIGDAGSQAGVAPAVVTTRRKRLNSLALAAAVGWLGVAALAAWIVLRGPSLSVAPHAFRADLVTPQGISMGPVHIGHVAVSPDGSRLAFTAGGEDGFLLTVRDLTTGEVKRLEGTDDVRFPFWSPDGRWLAFFAGEKLKKIEAKGGPVQNVAEAHAGRGGSWGPDGTIVFAADIHGPLKRVSENGGTAEPVTSPASDQLTHRMPHVLPGGEQFLFIQRNSRDEAFGDILAGSLDGTEMSVVVERASNPQYADGYLFFVRDGNLMAQRFDPASLTVEGSLIPIADSIEYYNPRDIGNYSVSDAGLLVYRQTIPRETQLAWFDATGKELATVGDAGLLSSVRLSPDGSLAVMTRYDRTEASSDLWVMDLERGQLTRSTFVSTSGEIAAIFSPSGDRLAVASFVGAGGNGGGLWIQPLSGSGSREMLAESTSFFAEDWSRDSRHLIGAIQESETGHDVAYIDLDDDSHEVRTFVATRFEEGSPRISPDGKWLAYVSNETGNGEVFLSDFPGARRKWQISTGGGSSPEWSPDGRELYFPGAEGLMAVTIAGSESVEIGAPQSVLDFEKLEGQDIADGISFDGERLLVLKYVGEASPEPLRLIRNWKTELEH